MHSGTSSSHALNVITYADGTKSILVQGIGDTIDFSAAGATLCKITITSPFLSNDGNFLMVKNHEDYTESLSYFLMLILRTTGSSTYQLGAIGSNIITKNAGLSTGYGMNRDYFISTSSNLSGLCGINLQGLKVVSIKNTLNFSGIIPASWKSTRTGILNFTMTVEGGSETPVIQ